MSSRSRGKHSPVEGKALVFQHVTAGQGRPAHTPAPSALEPEAGACEGLVRCPPLARDARSNLQHHKTQNVLEEFLPVALR